MLPRLRRHLRVLAALVLVSVSSIGAWSTAAHGLNCHDAEDVLIVAHDASAHAFRGTALPAAEHEIHCVLCHWTRAFGPCVASAAAPPAAVSDFLARPSATAAIARLTASAQPPLRAPPSASTLVSPA